MSRFSLSRVLVVEDEPLIAMMVQEWLEELDCAIVGPASSVASALELLKDCTPDCAVLDVSLGDGNCFPIADQLSRRGIPFLFATGLGSDSVPSRFSGTPIVGKPYEPTRLRRTVQMLLARKDVRAC